MYMKEKDKCSREKEKETLESAEKNLCVFYAIKDSIFRGRFIREKEMRGDCGSRTRGLSFEKSA